MQQLPKKMPKRIVIYAKDVENITGRKTKTGRKLLYQIREQNKKPKEAFVTIRSFACTWESAKMGCRIFCLINNPAEMI